MEEEGLIRQVLDGDAEKYRELVKRYEGYVYSMIIRQVVDESLARELTQDAFIRAYFSLEKFRMESKFSTWLTRIALNLCNSYFSSRRYKELQMTEALTDVHIENLYSKEEEGFSLEDKKKLHFAIQKLKPKYREILALCSLEGKSYKETAELLGIAEGTVGSRLNTALKQLKKIYFRLQ